MTLITIANDLLTIGTKAYNSGIYSADADGDQVKIILSSDRNDRIFEAKYNAIKLNNVAYASAPLFCAAFNALAAAALKNAIDALKANTDYTDSPFSRLLTPAAEAKVLILSKKGYAILSAPDTNTGIILYGPAGLTAENAGLAPGQSVVIESGDLSRWFVKNVTATDKVNIAGEFKD